MNTRPPRFTAWKPPSLNPRPPKVFKQKPQVDRNSHYDARWDRLSIAFRKRHPFCDECEKRGNDVVPAEVAAHIIPVQDRPELRLDWRNLRSLCTRCNAVMREIERYAREHGLTDKLPQWCEDLQSRPTRFRPPPLTRIGSHGAGSSTRISERTA